MSHGRGGLALDLRRDRRSDLVSIVATALPSTFGAIVGATLASIVAATLPSTFGAIVGATLTSLVAATWCSTFGAIGEATLAPAVAATLPSTFGVLAAALSGSATARARTGAVGHGQAGRRGNHRHRRCVRKGRPLHGASHLGGTGWRGGLHASRLNGDGGRRHTTLRDTGARRGRRRRGSVGEDELLARQPNGRLGRRRWGRGDCSVNGRGGLRAPRTLAGSERRRHGGGGSRPQALGRGSRLCQSPRERGFPPPRGRGGTAAATTSCGVSAGFTVARPVRTGAVGGATTTTPAETSGNGRAVPAPVPAVEGSDSGTEWRAHEVQRRSVRRREPRAVLRSAERRLALSRPRGPTGTVHPRCRTFGRWACQSGQPARINGPRRRRQRPRRNHMMRG